MTTGERIKARRKELGISAEKLAEVLHVSPATVYRYEKGDIEKVPGQHLQPIAHTLHTTVSFLMGWDGDDSSVSLEAYAPRGRMPVLGRVSAGLPLLASENIEGYVDNDFPDSESESYFALRVSGDSMTAAGIGDGDLVIIRQQSDVDDGRIALVLVNGDDATIKRIYRDGPRVTLMPQSYNPIHQPQIYSLKNTVVRIIGIVVEVRRRIL